MTQLQDAPTTRAITSSAYVAAVMQSQPVSYWQLGANATDSVGGRNGTVNGGVTFGTTDPWGGTQAALFNGTTGYITVPYDPALNTSPFSIEAWLRADTISAPSAMALTSRQSTSNGYALVRPGATARFSVAPGASSDVVGAYSVGTWLHQVGVFDPVQGLVYNYVNGVLRATWALVAMTPNPSSPLAIGREQFNATGYWTGAIAHVAYYNRALSPAEIAAHYATFGAGVAPILVMSPKTTLSVAPAQSSYSSAVLASAPLAYWPLSDPVGSASAVDLTGSGHTGQVVTTGGPVTFGVPDPWGAAAAVRLDGTGGQIISTLQEVSSGPVTIECWMRTTLVAQQTLVEFNASAPSAVTPSGNWFTGFGVHGNGQQRGVFQVGLNSAGGPVISDGAWHHVAMVVTGGGGVFGIGGPSNVSAGVSSPGGWTTTYYCDGVQSASFVAPAAGSQTRAGATGYWRMGRGGALGTFTGDIAHVAVYNRALPLAELRAHYLTPTPYQAAVMTSLPVAYWPLSDAVGSTTATELIAKRNGTVAASGVTFGKSDPWNAARAVALNGAATVATPPITVPYSSALNPSPPFSVEAWVLPDASDTSTTVRVAVASRAAGGPLGYALYRNFSNTNTGISIGAVNVIASRAAGAWLHLVGTYDGANGLLYVNGALAQTTPQSTYTPNTTVPFVIGVDTFGGDIGWIGSLAHVAFYNRVLSASEIQGHYQSQTVNPPPAVAYQNAVMASGPVSYWPLAADGTDVIAGRTATPSGGVTFGASDPFGGTRAAQFDGTTGYMTVPYAAALNPPEFSVEAWANADNTTAGQFAIVCSRVTFASNGYMLMRTSATSAHWGITGTYAGGGAASPFVIGQWKHLVGVYSAGQMTLFANGVQVATSAVTAVQNPSAALTIGRNETVGGPFWSSRLAHIAVYNRALSAAEIVNHYSAASPAFNVLNAENSSFEGGTVGDWVPNGTGCTLANSTAQAFAGTHSLAITCGTGGSAIPWISPPIAASSTSNFTLMMNVRAATVGRSMSTVIHWYDSSMAELGTNSFNSFTDTVGSWYNSLLTASANPGVVAFARIGVVITGGVNGEVHYIDNITLIRNS